MDLISNKQTYYVCFCASMNDMRECTVERTLDFESENLSLIPSSNFHFICSMKGLNKMMMMSKVLSILKSEQQKVTGDPTFSLTILVRNWIQINRFPVLEKRRKNSFVFWKFFKPLLKHFLNVR